MDNKKIRSENRALIECALALAEKIDVKNILILTEFALHKTLLDQIRFAGKNVILAVGDEKLHDKLEAQGIQAVLLAHHDLSRIDRIKHSIMAALGKNYLDKKDKVICVCGLPGPNPLDNLIVLNIGKEISTQVPLDVIAISGRVSLQIVETVLSIAIELGYEGREGSSVGALFVIGDSRKVMERSRQLVFNPFKGYPENERNIMNPIIREGIKEFSMIDGAFIIRNDGVVLAAGRYLDSSAEWENAPLGLGARHAAAASITKETQAIAITVSETNGTVRVFKDGEITMEIDQSRRGGGISVSRGKFVD